MNDKEFVEKVCCQCENNHNEDCNIVKRMDGNSDCTNKKIKSNLEKFAENELNIILNKCEDTEAIEMQKIMNNDILQIIKVFSEQGHSGFSAGYAINLLEKLLRFEPVTPLTGNEDEWTKLDYGEDTMYQNKRCSRVFKNAEGRAYDIEGKAFSKDNGKSWYTCRDSRVYVEFPYVPKTEKIILENKEEK